MRQDIQHGMNTRYFASVADYDFTAFSLMPLLRFRFYHYIYMPLRHRAIYADESPDATLDFHALHDARWRYAIKSRERDMLRVCVRYLRVRACC